MHEAIVRPTLKSSWAYQYRMQLTAVVLGAAWIYVALSPPWIPRGSAFDQGIEAAAWITFLGGALLRLWATLWIAGRKKQTVVDDGPYRACRNPLYVGTFTMAFALALFLKSAVFAVGLAVVLAMYFQYVVPAEERYLRSKFAAAYDDYCARVPRWIPRLSLLGRDDIFRWAADRGALSRECMRMVCWMLLPV